MCYCFSSLAGDIVMLLAGTAPLAKALKGWGNPQAGIS